jgi:hypothetical protein
MSAVSEIVTLAIDIKDAAVSQAGFGTPLIAGYHTAWAERVRTFSDPAELLDAGIEDDDPIYLDALKVMSQSPRPEQFKVGKLLGGRVQTIKLTPGTPAEGDVFSLLVDGQTVSVTAGSGDVVADVCDDLVTALGEVTGVTPTDVSTHVTSAGAAGALHTYENLSSNLTLEDVTADPATHIADDLAAIRAYDEDWYWLHVPGLNGKTQILLAAAWAETQKLILLVEVRDSGVLSGAVSDDVCSALKTASYNRTVAIWHHRPDAQFAAGAWAGRIAPKAPGSYTAANKSLSGVDKSTLSDTDRAQLRAKNCNYYVDVKGIGFTLDGRAAGGRYIDITHGIDWFEARTIERVVYVQANNDKIPFTDKGIALFVAQVEGQILNGIGAGLIDGDSPHNVTAPKARDVSANDRTQRLLRDVKFDFVLQGAVHKVQINGTVRTAPAEA